MSAFLSTAVVNTYICHGTDSSPEAASNVSASDMYDPDPSFHDDHDGQYSFSGLSESPTQDEQATHDQQAPQSFFGAIFGSPSRPGRLPSATQSGIPKAGADDGEITKYWQNYDLSISEAPKLFSDAEFQAVTRIREGLEVLILRKRLQDRVLARNREQEVRAAVRVQAVVRGTSVRTSLPALREQHTLRASIKREYKLFKRELRCDGFVVDLYRNKDGALRRATLKPNAKLNSICWSMGVASVKTGSVPLIALKSCYTGYPKKNFPTKSMQARATPLPDKTKTFTIQVDNGTTHVFVADGGTHAPSVKKLVKGLQSIIDEVSSPDSFYFGSSGVLRRVTSSIFDDRGNIAQRERLVKQRQERFRLRQEDSEARRAAAALRPQGPAGKKANGPFQNFSHNSRRNVRSTTDNGFFAP